MDRSCLVIGGSGFVGGYLVKKLTAKGYQVYSTYHSNPAGKNKLSSRVEQIKVDICDYNSVDVACSNLDYIFLSTNIKPSEIPLEEYNKKMMQLNTTGIHNVVQAAIKHGVKKIILLSSVAAMGTKHGLEVYDEKSSFEPTDVYGKSKLAAEEIVLDYYKQGAIDITILRPTAIYGKGSLGPLQKIVTFINKGFVPVIGNGDNLQSLTYVENVANAAIDLAESSNSSGHCYIVSDEQPYSVNDLIDTVGKQLGATYKTFHIPEFFLKTTANFCDSITKITKRQMPITLNSVEAIVQSRVFQTKKIKKEIGFNFEFNLVKGVQHTLGSLTDHS